MTRTTWEAFINSRMLWFVNRLLHVFGWAIVVAYDENDQFVEAYPARTKVLGFPETVDFEARAAFLAAIDPACVAVITDAAELPAEDQAVVAKVDALSED